MLYHKEIMDCGKIFSLQGASQAMSPHSITQVNCLKSWHQCGAFKAKTPILCKNSVWECLWPPLGGRFEKTVLYLRIPISSLHKSHFSSICTVNGLLVQLLQKSCLPSPQRTPRAAGFAKQALLLIYNFCRLASSNPQACRNGDQSCFPIFMPFYHRNLFSLVVGKGQPLLWHFCRVVRGGGGWGVGCVCVLPVLLCNLFPAFLHPNYEVTTQPDLK